MQNSLKTFLYKHFKTKQLIPKTLALFLCLIPQVNANDLNQLKQETTLESSFKDRTKEIIGLLTRIPEEDQSKVLDYLKKSWNLYENPSRLIDEIKVKYNLIEPDNPISDIPYHTEQIPADGLTEEESAKFRRKVSHLSTPTGKPKLDLEGAVYCIAALSYEVDRNTSNNGLTQRLIDSLSRVADFLIETTDTAKAAEEALTKHQMLEGARNVELSRKIEKWDSTEERTTFYDQSRKAISKKFLRRLRELGFGHISIDLDSNLSSPNVDEISLSILKTHFAGYILEMDFFVNRDELKAFRYDKGPYLENNLTPLEK